MKNAPSNFLNNLSWYNTKYSVSHLPPSLPHSRNRCIEKCTALLYDMMLSLLSPSYLVVADFGLKRKNNKENGRDKKKEPRSICNCITSSKTITRRCKRKNIIWNNYLHSRTKCCASNKQSPHSWTVARKKRTNKQYQKNIPQPTNKNSTIFHTFSTALNPPTLN